MNAKWLAKFFLLIFFLHSLFKKVLKFLKKILHRFGYYLDKIDRDSSSMAGGLLRMSRHTPVATFVDIGASDGRWTQLAQKYYPQATYLLIEAQQGHHEDLMKFKNSCQNVIIEMTAAGDSSGELYFDAADLHGGLASKNPLQREKVITVRSERADRLVEKYDLSAPFALKLDTHGFEVPIFEGAAGILTQTNLIIVEAYNFRIADASLKFYEMCAYLEEKGFLCADIVDIMRRPEDDLLWQADLFFLRKSRPEFQKNTYR